jgi:uncharacterized membrane protein (DUF106 family)
MAKKPVTDGQSDTIPVPKAWWEGLYYFVMKVLKYGPAWAVLVLILVGVYCIMSKQTTIQAELVAAVKAKNDIIQQNHDLLIASQARDEATVGTMKDMGMVLQEVVHTLDEANHTMEPVPKMREKSLAMQQEQLDQQREQLTQQREHGKLLEKLLTKLDKSVPAVPNGGNGP